MISIEAWRGRIGSWAGRVRLSSLLSGPKMNVSVRHILDILWGISSILVVAVISVILIVGGVELNPGPLRMDLSSSSDEDLELPKGFDFGATCKGNYVFSLPPTSLSKMKYKRRVLVGSKMYPRKFGVHIKREKVALAPEYPPVPTSSSQTSVTESLDVLELSAKVPRISEETQNENISIFG